MIRQTAAPGRACITIEAPARLHMGFLDLNGGLGRRYGSIGVALRNFATRVVVRAADAGLSAGGPDAARALAYARELCRELNLPAAAAIEVVRTVPAHAGLGSGTQLALAIGVGLARLHGLSVDAGDIARIAARGARSGIGVGVFRQGGFVVDGGRGSCDGIPPVIVRLRFPDAWHFVLVLDDGARGLHGAVETSAFRGLAEFSAARAAHLCRLVLMQMLPALRRRDLGGFGSALTELQGILGDYFAPAQGGRYRSARVGAALAWLAGQGATGIGQSSWGPTGFALVADARAALALRTAAERAFASQAGLRFVATPARNTGALVQLAGALAPREPAAMVVPRRAARSHP